MKYQNYGPGPTSPDQESLRLGAPDVDDDNLP